MSYRRVQKTSLPPVVQSEYCSRNGPYFFRPGHWCANLVSGFQVKFADLPDQPTLKRNVVYKVKSFPAELGSGKHVYIFNMDTEEYLAPYHRTGWEFTASGTIMWGAVSLGLTALVTIPVSTVLLIVHKMAKKKGYDDIVWFKESLGRDEL